MLRIALQTTSFHLGPVQITHSSDGTAIDGDAFLLEDKDVVEIAGVRMELVIRA